MMKTSNPPGYDFIHYSKVLSRNKSVRIISPNAEHPSTIVYLLHPFGANRFFWTDFFSDFSCKNAVFILPESGRSWFINDAKDARYEDYFVYELIPSIEEQFQTIKRRVVGGFSMGGAAAFFLAFRHSELFDLAFSLAGAFDAFERAGDPYASVRQKENLMIPTIEEHERVWGKLGSITRSTYNLVSLYNQLQKKIITQFAFEVGVNDYERIIQMNQKTKDFFKNVEISHFYNEFSGEHTKIYAYQGLNRIIKEYICDLS